MKKAKSSVDDPVSKMIDKINKEQNGNREIKNALINVLIELGQNILEALKK